jgi:hypothetical protein
MVNHTRSYDQPYHRVVLTTPEGMVNDTSKYSRLYLGQGAYSTTTTTLSARPKVSGEYISSAFVGGTTKRPGVVARAW